MKNSGDSPAELLKELEQLRSELTTAKQTSEEHFSALCDSEQRFMLAMRGANDGLWDWNIETDEVYYSPRWKSMLGYAEDELEPTLQTWINLVHPDDTDWVREKASDYLEGQTGHFEVEFRMQHKEGREIIVQSRGFKLLDELTKKPVRLLGIQVDITARKKAEILNEKTSEILEMIARGRPALEIYDAIALMYEARNPGLRCSMLELDGNKLLHGGAPSLPKEYCEAVHGLENGPCVGSCGTSTYTGKRVLVENIETDPKWAKIKHVALPHGLRCCWSEPIKSSSGKVLGAFGMYYNHPALPNEQELKDLISAARLTSIVMERDQAQRCIHQMAYFDELTGLPSRAHFYKNLEELIKTSHRHQRRFGVLYIDLDDFKSVNDSLGHDAGDLLLIIVAERLRAVSREGDFVARLSGDEFCILVEETGEYDAANVAERCLTAISETIEMGTRKLVPSCSIGIANYPDDGETLASIIKAADTSLYAAKEKGKQQYAFYHNELTEKAEYRFHVEHCLREAIEKRELTLVYQPQFDLATGEMVGVEALSRWSHPDLGNVNPEEFITTAERIGMIKSHTEWVLNTACHQLMEWKKAGASPGKISINLSPKHFLDPEIVPLIKRVIEKTGIEPGALMLEVTEGVVQTDQENIVIFTELKELGVKLAIDDFGSGYSSFASLKHLKIDCLKIDKYFINDMLHDHVSMTLISSMIKIGRKLGYLVIAEGVETEEQRAILENLNCNAVQGYLFSRPVRPDEIAKLLQG